MKTMKDYVVKQETMAFLPKYTKHGKLTTLVMESGMECSVNMSTQDLMDHCLRYYGASLREAMESTKKILASIHMCPIRVSENLTLYWFSAKSPEKEERVWFALHHIRGYESVGLKETRVTLSNGAKVTIEMSLYSFKEKIQRAYQLKEELEERSKTNTMMGKEMKVSYYIRKKAGILQCERK